MYVASSCFIPPPPRKPEGKRQLLNAQIHTGKYRLEDFPKLIRVNHLKDILNIHKASAQIINLSRDSKSLDAFLIRDNSSTVTSLIFLSL